MSQFTIIKVELQNTLVKSFFESDNFTIKSMTIKAHNQSNVNVYLISL